MTSIPNLTMNDGRTIPQLGFGTYQVPQERAEVTVAEALAVGYRHIDTAQMYGNEAGVGAAIAASGLERSSLFVTSKLNNGNHRPDDVRASFDQTLALLGLDYLDLFLIHWPLPTQYDGDFVSTWEAVAELRADGRLKSAGVSNFQPDHLARIVDATGAVPAVNQIEVHPYFSNEVARQDSIERGILVEAWSPIAQGSIIGDPMVAAIAEQIGRTEAQVVLRWHIQRGDIIFPKTMSAERMRENLAIFDFELSAEQMGILTALDRGADGRVGPDPDVFDVIG